MSRFDAVNTIRLFDFYLAAMFVMSFARRYVVYWDAVYLLVILRGRWPRLLDRLKEHHGVLVTGEVLRPLGFAFVLMAIQLVCSRAIWPHAELTVGDVTGSAWRLLVVLAAMLPMVAVDVYFLVRVGRFDRSETEKYLDLAEHWLTTWKTPVVRAVTLGYVNPQRMVDDEVKKGLEQLGQTVSWASWWVAAQVACRVTFGLVIWLLWAVG